MNKELILISAKIMILAVVLGFIFLAGFYIYLHTDFSYKENKQKERIVKVEIIKANPLTNQVEVKIVESF